MARRRSFRGGAGLVATGVLAATALAGVAGTGVPAAAAPAPVCAPEDGPVVLVGGVDAVDAATYRTLPFAVAPGTTRVEVGYRWTDRLPLPSSPASGLVQTVLDLGLWDEGGVGTPAGFRGWSGSRQGRLDRGQPPAWVQADTAERGYRPGPVVPGTWHVDLGVAAVAPGGADYEVVVRCLAGPVGPTPPDRPVDAAHVADPRPGWYSADLHLHAYHSHPAGPDPEAMLADAVAAGLDVVPVTEYVTDQHQHELGSLQAAHPEVVVWPGREVITYFGHAIVLGETPSVVDWRHGAPGVTLREIQRASVADGALFGVAHPTIFPTPLFASFCRGCEFRLGDHIDWDLVTTLEVVTGPILVGADELGLPDLGVEVQNPFVLTAIELWQRLLREGHRITAVAGSDDKLGDGYGAVATAIHAGSLSRPALAEGLRRGHAYVQARGPLRSPAVEVRATAPDGQTGIVGDTLWADAATLEVEVRGGAGQVLTLTSDGLPAEVVPVVGDPFVHRTTITRSAGSGPLGTFWRVDTADAQALTTIGNPVFLADPARRPAAPAPPTTAAPSAGGPSATLPATGPAGQGAGPGVGAALGVLGLAGLVAARGRRRPPAVAG